MQPPPGPRTERRGTVIGLVVALVVLGAGSGYYYVQSSGTMSSQGRTISTQSGQLANDAAQISADEGKVANLTSTVASLRGTVASDEAKIAALENGYTAANGSIATLNGQVTALISQISSDNAQIASLQSQITSLQATASLSSNDPLLKSQAVTTNSSGLVLLSRFNASYAGYVSITATALSNATDAGCFVSMTFSSEVVSPDFNGIVIPGGGYFLVFGAVPATLVFPVTPGTVSVYLATSGMIPQSATVSVTYFY